MVSSVKPKVSIILLTKNAGKRLIESLEIINKQNFKGTIEVIAVDSGSEDETLEILKDYDVNIFQIQPEEFHHSKTRNLGAEYANGEYLVYLTQDALPISKDWLTNLISPLKNKDIAVVYGRQIANPDAKIMDKFFYSYFYPENEITITKIDNNEKKFYLENIFISDVCSAMKKDIWAEIKFTDEVNMSEDKDFALKALKRNYKVIYEPKSAVHHSHDYNLISLFKRRFKDGSAFSEICLDGEDNFMGNGLKYFQKQIKFLAINGYKRWIPYAIMYSFVNFIGFKLGSKRNTSILNK